MAFLEGTFLYLVQTQPVYYVSWVVTLIVSIVLHELGHGVAALSQGDPTPRTSGHMTLNPLVHMGGFSLVLLFVLGIAFGMMPVDPSRFRSRHGDAIVSAAGPLVNLLLALIGLTVLGLWVRVGNVPETPFLFLLVFGKANIVLFLLNLIPVPPLDGSRVVASFVRPYRRVLADPNNQGLFFVVFIGVFLIAPSLFQAADEGAMFWHRWIAGR